MISRILVLAENLSEFRSWLLDSGLRETDPDVMYLSRPEQLRGYTHVKVIRCRRWELNPMASEIEREIGFMRQRSASR